MTFAEAPATTRLFPSHEGLTTSRAGNLLDDLLLSPFDDVPFSTENRPALESRAFPRFVGDSARPSIDASHGSQSSAPSDAHAPPAAIPPHGQIQPLWFGDSAPNMLTPSIAPDSGMIAEAEGGTPLPMIWIKATDSAAFEEVTDSGEFTVYVEAPVEAKLTVYYTVSGSASPGADYTSLAGSVDILIGNSSASFSVDAIDDGAIEGLEDVVVTLSADANYEIIGPDVATVIIYDDDESPPVGGSGGWGGTPTITLQTTDYASEIDQKPGEFVVFTNTVLPFDVTVYYAVAGSATNGVDYHTLPGSVVIPAYASHAHFRVIPFDDTHVEKFETVVTQLNSDPAYVVGWPDEAMMVLFDEGSGGTDGHVKVDLHIYHGQGGATPVENKNTVGAYTVANMNDTDGDGVEDMYEVDSAETGGVVASQYGKDEMDLMKLVLNPPVPDNGGHVTLYVTNGIGKVALWNDSKKTDPEALVHNPPGNPWVSYQTSELPKTLWVEITAASANARDVELEMFYGSHSDKVRATAVWVDRTAFEHDNRDVSGPSPSLLSDATWMNMPGNVKGLVQQYDRTGLASASASGVRNVVVKRFTVAPSDYNRLIVKFDITRRLHADVWMYRADQSVVRHVSRVPDDLNEVANDDSVDTDESDEPSLFGHMWVIDAPGITYDTPRQDEFYYTFRANFEEFVRVQFFDDPDKEELNPVGNGWVGSRASHKYLWHSRLTLEIQNGKWVRTTGDQNETNANDVGPGHITS